jgi:putative transposase
MYLPEYPYHIVQRGNNREACFIEPENYQYYLELWQECSNRYAVMVHAYCLMTNHIHFLATPQYQSSISSVMKVVGSRYAQYFNRKYKRTGTLWEGRHKSSLVQSKKYFLICSRYIELNPVTAKMAKRAEEYQWSSYGCNAWGVRGWLTAHEEYLNLGSTVEARANSYRELFKQLIDDRAIHLIRQAAHYCQPLGDDRFKCQIEKKYGIKTGRMCRGRPGKNTS